jgi:hypothetical protein
MVVRIGISAHKAAIVYKYARFKGTWKANKRNSKSRKRVVKKAMTFSHVASRPNSSLFSPRGLLDGLHLLCLGSSSQIVGSLYRLSSEVQNNNSQN